MTTNHTGSCFEGKAVLVTGGARGLGRSVALSFARQGARVAIADIDEATARETAGEISKLGRRVGVIIADVCDQSSAEGVLTARGRNDTTACQPLIHRCDGRRPTCCMKVAASQ